MLAVGSVQRDTFGLWRDGRGDETKWGKKLVRCSSDAVGTFGGDADCDPAVFAITCFFDLFCHVDNYDMSVVGHVRVHECFTGFFVEAAVVLPRPSNNSSSC